MSRFLFPVLILSGLILSVTSGHSQSTFFLEFNFDRGYTLCPTGAGNLYLAGMDGVDMVLMEITPDGAVVTARYLDVGINGLDVPSELIVDSEGKLIVAGNLAEDSPVSGFVFRYDPVLRQTLWAKTFGGDKTLVNGVVENGPGGNFLVYANPHLDSDGDDAEFLQLDRNTGNVVSGSAWRYAFGSSDQFNTMILDDGALYALGRFTEGSGSLAYEKMRQALLKIDPGTGAVQWARLGHVPQNGSARLYGRDLVIEQNNLVSVSSGDDAGSNLNNTAVFLQKSDQDGNLIWVRKFNFTEWTSEYAEELVSVPDGYVVFGRTLSDAEGALFLLKTDKDGQLLWARKIRQGSGSRSLSVLQNQMIALGSELFVAGYSLGAANTSRAFLLKADPNGEVGDSCAVFVPTDVVAQDVTNPVHNAFTPDVDTSFTTVFDLPVAPSVLFIPQRQIICQKVQDDCQNLPDITYTIDSVVCGNGKMVLHYTVCNQGGGSVDNLTTVFYDGNPTQTAANVLVGHVLLLNPPLQSGECQSGTFTNQGTIWFPDGLDDSVNIYSVTNHSHANLQPPFSLDSFPSTDLMECDYTNNLSFVPFSPGSLMLDLGPDIILCDSNATTLDAGPGFFKYLWNTGAQTQTLDVFTPGTYWVEVTDDCGLTQRDSLFFSFSLLPDTQFPDSTICPGESLTYSVPGFDAYAWAPANGLSCANCPAVTFQPAVTTTYTLLATTVNGCVLTDTFTLFVLSDPAGVSLQCPSNVVVVADPGASAAPAFYDDPAAGTSCPCGGASWTLIQGLPSGANFPLGATQVCFEAKDGCNGASSCCFSVTVESPSNDEPCDVKETPCVRFEILGIAQNTSGQKTYTMRVVNKCPNELVYVAYQLPNGQTALQPANNSIYTSPVGSQYTVRNPNASPFQSIRFSANSAGIADGESDVFEYTLPPQANPTFIQVRARLAPQLYYEAHLNVFACEVRKVLDRPENSVGDREMASAALPDDLFVFPNPVRNTLFVNLTSWTDQPVQVQLTDVLGRHNKVMQTGGGYIHEIDLPEFWAPGWYFLTVMSADGTWRTTRFVKTN